MKIKQWIWKQNALKYDADSMLWRHCCSGKVFLVGSSSLRQYTDIMRHPISGIILVNSSTEKKSSVDTFPHILGFQSCFDALAKYFLNSFLFFRSQILDTVGAEVKTVATEPWDMPMFPWCLVLPWGAVIFRK